MFRSGWIRLWMVASTLTFICIIGLSSYYVWGESACYRFATISAAKNLSEKDRTLFDYTKRETVSKVFCGNSFIDPLLTIEDMAQRGAITQVGLEWLEPSGWSMATQSSLEVLDGKEIKAEKIIDHIFLFAGMPGNTGMDRR